MLLHNTESAMKREMGDVVQKFEQAGREKVLFRRLI
jgi:hypothetical protein